MNAPKIFKLFLPLLILALGVLGVRGLMSLKKSAEKKPPSARIDTVEFLVVEAGAPRAIVRASGVVEGDKQVSLSSLVSGEVVSVSDRLVPGGRFSRGEVLLRVDPRDYEIGVAQERARVQQAELELTLEEQRGSTAEREWELLGGGAAAEDAPLALRKPQLDNVRKNVQAAQAGLDRAKLNLERSTMRAPFNALVLQESVEEGQLLAPGAAVVTLIGTDRFRVRVSVPVQQLAHIAIAGVNGPTGSRARVVQDLGGGARIEREGQVMQLAGQLDPQTRTAEVYIGIDQPLVGAGLPLLPGAFVNVEIEGEPVEGAIAVPRDVLVDGEVVWTVTDDDRLTRSPVVLGWRDGDTAFLIEGVADGARVVVVPPSLPIEGAQVNARPVGVAPAPTATEG